MGRYITWADVTARYTRLTTLPNSSEALHESFIEGAEAEVDGRLSAVYTVPFSDTNATVKDLSVDLVMLKAGVLNEKEYDRVLARIDDRFKRLVSGAEKIIVTSGDLLVDRSQAWSNTQDHHSAFGYLDTSEQGFDYDQLHDEANAREDDTRG